MSNSTITAPKELDTNKESLIYLYWGELRSSVQIAYILNLSDPKHAVDLLKEHNIPLRPIDISKQHEPVTRQFNKKNPLNGAKLTSDGAEITSQSINCKNYQRFFFYISLAKSGTPTSANVQIIIEFSFNEKTWFPIQDDPFNALFESNNTIPISWNRTARASGDFIRVRFVADGTNLSTTNYFSIEEIHFVFM